MASTLDQTRERVAEYLEACVGDGVQTTDEGQSFPFGSTRLVVSAFAGPHSDFTFVHLRAHVAHEVPVSDRLFRWLAFTSNELLFGRLGMAPDVDETHVELTIEHVLLGDYLDLEELRTAIAFVANAADNLDDVVVDMFGGRRFVDG